MKDTMEEWLYPFQGRRASGAITLNLLWRSGNLFVMDNHRAAAWCWAQYLKGRPLHNVLHIDAHYDTVGLPYHNEIGPPPDEMALQEYLDLPAGDPDLPMPRYRWDNYLSFYEHHYRLLVKRWQFATHHIGTRPDFKYKPIAAKSLITRVDELAEAQHPWVVNLDLDYFRNQDGFRYPAEDRATLFQQLAAFRTSSHCLVMTVCLSPECCGGWPEAEELCYKLMDAMQVNFRLPPGPIIEDDD